MDKTVLNHLIQSYLALDFSHYTFGWQGGEPMLMGTDFFREVINLQARHGSDGAIVCNGLQTNGTLIDEETARFLAATKFLVGISIDGEALFHDKYRQSIHGKGTHHKTIQGLDRLRRHGVATNALCVINSGNVTSPRDIYHYFRNRQFTHHQYIPCVEFDRSGRPLPFTISGSEWGQFLCTLFDEWYPDDIGIVSIRLFDTILEQLIYQASSSCHANSYCGDYFLIEYNGDVYPCDFFVTPEWKIGNIMKDSWETLRASKKYHHFARQKAVLSPRCIPCRFFKFCAGDCLKHCYYDNKNSKTLSWLCDGWEMFYCHTVKKFKEIAQNFMTRQKGRPISI